MFTQLVVRGDQWVPIRNGSLCGDDDSLSGVEIATFLSLVFSAHLGSVVVQHFATSCSHLRMWKWKLEAVEGHRFQFGHIYQTLKT